MSQIRIIGIDPGIVRLGYAVLDLDTSRPRHALMVSVVQAGCFEPDSKPPLEQRLLSLFHGVAEVMNQLKPEEMAIESVFMDKNVNSALVLGQARATAVCAAASHAVRFFSYAPRTIKQTVTGQGNASKEQVTHMLRSLLGYYEPLKQDAFDAMACAYCHAERRETHKRIEEMIHDSTDTRYAALQEVS